MASKKGFLLCLIIGILTACGFKGDLYLPQDGEEDPNNFGVIQTGINIEPPTNTEDK